MVLDPIPDARPGHMEEFEIRQVSGSEEITQFLRTGASGFGTPLNYFDVWKAGILAGASLSWSRGANYLGYVGGKPVATSTSHHDGRRCRHLFRQHSRRVQAPGLRRGDDLEGDC